MDDTEFLEAVREDQQTELSRLGSSKSLYADTGGEMEADPVLGAIATQLSHAADTFEGWADEESGPAADLFAETADTVGEHHGTVADEGDDEPGPAPAVVDYLRDLDTTVERVAGLVGWALVTENKVGQAVGFFVGQASPGTASSFRTVRDDVGGAVDDGAAVLVAVCEDESDWDLASEAATGAVAAAYDEYVADLEAQGVNPKPVC
jgi:hypothetical protein